MFTTRNSVLYIYHCIVVLLTTVRYNYNNLQYYVRTRYVNTTIMLCGMYMDQTIKTYARTFK